MKDDNKDFGVNAERLKIVLEAANEGFYDWNMETGEAYFSPRYYTMLGYKPNEVPASYETWLTLIHPEDKEYALNTVKELSDGKRDNYEIEYRLKTKSDEWRWIISRGKVIKRDDKGNPLRMVGTHVDFTERKLAEDEIKTRVEDLEEFYKMSIGRETKMIELKKEIMKLKAKLSAYENDPDN